MGKLLRTEAIDIGAGSVAALKAFLNFADDLPEFFARLVALEADLERLADYAREWADSEGDFRDEGVLHEKMARRHLVQLGGNP